MTKKNPRADTRTRIIKAATKLFAEQGYQQTTIAEIAREVGLAEGSIYEHFRGKEDLLLTIPDVWVTNAIEELKLQLFGIEGAINKLRKFLWWYLNYIEREPMTAKVVFLFLKKAFAGLGDSLYMYLLIISSIRFACIYSWIFMRKINRFKC